MQHDFVLKAYVTTTVMMIKMFFISKYCWFYKLFSGHYFMIHITCVLIEMILIITMITIFAIQYDTCLRQNLNISIALKGLHVADSYITSIIYIIWFHLFEHWFNCKKYTQSNCMRYVFLKKSLHIILLMSTRSYFYKKKISFFTMVTTKI